MTTTYLDVQYRLGDIEANIGAGSDAVIATAISGAYPEVLSMTGSSSDKLVKHIVANLAAADVATSFLGRSNQSVSNLRTEMVLSLKETAARQIKAIGVKSGHTKVNP